MPNEKNWPDWAKDAIFYQIFPDCFARSKEVTKSSNLEPWHSQPSPLGFKGGDLLGICEHLDYLESLGINAIYLNPIFQATYNHRYATIDFFRIDPLLGGEPAFQKLLNECKERGIRMVIDGVFNHTGRGFYQFQHVLDSLADSPYLDWFYIKWLPLNAYNFEEKPINYETFNGRPGLPKLNVENPTVKEFLYKVGEYWLQFGIDGWRLDAPGEIKDWDFWREFRNRMKHIRPDAYLVGEIWDDAVEWLRGDIFDATTNYPFTRACLGFFGQGRLVNELAGVIGGICERNAQEFDIEIHRLLHLHSSDICQMQLNLLDSHDSARFISMCGGDTRALRLAVLFQMTFPGVPLIYYGDEIGMEGGLDPDCRRAFPWYSEEDWDHDLLNYYKQCIQLRKDHTVLRRGQFQTVYAENRTYAYLRSDAEQSLLVVLNTSEAAESIGIQFSPAMLNFSDGNCTLRFIPLLGNPQSMNYLPNVLSLVVPARDGLVFRIEGVSE